MLKTLTFAALHFSVAFSITYSELPMASALLPSCTCVLRAAAAGTIRAEPKLSSRLKASVPKCKRQPEWSFGLPLICIMES